MSRKRNKKKHIEKLTRPQGQSLEQQCERILKNLGMSKESMYSWSDSLLIKTDNYVVLNGNLYRINEDNNGTN